MENGRLISAASGNAVITYTTSYGNKKSTLELNVQTGGHVHDYRLESWHLTYEYIVTTGTSSTVFSLGSTCTKGHAATFLSRTV